MNGKELLIALGDISHKYYDEAENETIKSTHKTLKRPLLIAAIVALMLFLMGCAVVYALRLQDMSIGQESYTQIFDDDGKYLEEPVEKTRDVLTLFGHSGDNIQKATAEWFAFLETYDPDGKLADNNPDHEEIPNAYEYTYGCYTLDMAAKVDEIAAKYDLKLLEEWLPFQAWQSDIFLEESGIHSLVLPDSGAEVTRLSGMFYPPYNFDVDIELSADELENELWITVLYARKDYFPRDYPGGTDLSLYEQWDYTTPDGTVLLLALNGKGHGYVIAELENAMMILFVDGNYSTSSYPTAEEVMTREELEFTASVFDYSIQPHIVDRTKVDALLEESDAAHEAENVYVPETFGSFTDYLKADILIYDDDLKYTFYDLTGDGEDDLLIGKNGAVDKCLYIHDGEVIGEFFSNSYVCEGGILENYSAYEIFEDHQYVIPNFITNPGETDTVWSSLKSVNRTRDKWIVIDPGEFEGTEITAEEAENIMDQYPRVEMNWQPMMEYPLSEGYTVGNYLEEKDVRLSGEEVREVYREYLQKRADNGNMYYSHYRILDINGDGVDDLLLKGKDSALGGNTDFYWLALTYRYGIIEGFASDFYLCEDGVIEHVSTRHAGGIGVEKNGHQFMRCIEFDEELYELVIFNKSTAGWQTDWWDDEPISEDEANAILDKYPRIDQGMLPISDLLN